MNVLPGDPGALIARFNPLHYSLSPLSLPRLHRAKSRFMPLKRQGVGFISAAQQLGL